MLIFLSSISPEMWERIRTFPWEVVLIWVAILGLLAAAIIAGGDLRKS